MQNSPSELRRAFLGAAFAFAAVLASRPAPAQSSPAAGGAHAPPVAAPGPTTTLIPGSTIPPLGATPQDPLAPPLLTQHSFGLAVGGVGAIGFLVGAALGITAVVKKDESNASGHCLAGNLCDRTGAALRYSSLDYGNWSTAMFIAGATLFAGGLVLMATAPIDTTTPPPPIPPLRVSARLTLGPGSLQLTGSW